MPPYNKKIKLKMLVGNMPENTVNALPSIKTNCASVWSFWKRFGGACGSRLDACALHLRKCSTNQVFRNIKLKYSLASIPNHFRCIWTCYAAAQNSRVAQVVAAERTKRFPRTSWSGYEVEGASTNENAWCAQARAVANADWSKPNDCNTRYV